MNRKVWLVVVALGSAELRAAGTGASEAQAASSPPVVLELFTSQGCSSCPSADQLLSLIGRDETTRERVVPLAFHVDYWDRLGWRDPWSDAAWSARQAAYCRALGVADGPYTPQLVVHGRLQLNGSDAPRLRRVLAAATESAPRAIVTLAAREAAGGSLAVSVGAEVLSPIEARRLELLVALYESGLVTSVARGENHGRTLRDDFVVRRLERAFTLRPEAGARGERELQLKPARGSVRANLGVAAFLQDPDTMRIYAAAVERALSPPGQ